MLIVRRWGKGGSSNPRIAGRTPSAVLSERPAGCAGTAGPHQADCEAWCQFVDHYDRFIEVLCTGAKYGCCNGVELEYGAVRGWFQRHYPGVANRLRPFLDCEFAADGSRSGVTSAESPDVFEEILQFGTMHEMLQRDGGDLIGRIDRLSAAIYRCHSVGFMTD
ncbi:MAG: hypothetical protein ACLQVD_01295 [Capsulimonadaceae bacterium]